MRQPFYHGTSIPNIKTLEPRSHCHRTAQSTVGEPCSEKVLYLTSSIPYALVYIWDHKKTGTHAKWVTCGIQDGVVFYEEQFPNQLLAFYQGVSGYLYEVEAEISETRSHISVSPLPNREEIYISYNPLPVQYVIHIPDVYEELLRHEKEGIIQIRRFTEQPRDIQAELTQRIITYIQQKQLLSKDSEESHFIQRFFVDAWCLAKK